MSTEAQQGWQHVPHQHRGPHQHKGADDHIYSPKLHNGTFKSQGIATFMGAPYCPPDRNAIRAMGAKVCFIGVPWDQGQVVRAGTSQGAAGIREASTQYFPYMFEYDVDLLTFFRIVDCGDIPIVPGNNDQVARVHLSLSDGMPARRGQGRFVRRRSFSADPRRPRALRFSQEWAHRLSPRRLPSRRGA